MSDTLFLSDNDVGLLRKAKKPISLAELAIISHNRNIQLEELPSSLEGLVGNSADFLPFSFLEEGVSRGNSVVRIEVRKQTPAGLQVLGHGTGFLITQDLLMTNNHVLANAAMAAHSLAQFRYEIDISGSEKVVDNWELDPTSFFVTSPKDELDFTIVRLKEQGGKKPAEIYGFVPLRAEDRVMVGERVNVIQHPDSRRKEVVLYESNITAFFEDAFVHYAADTLRGSSGAPVFNQQWDLVALHHSGVFKKDANGDYVIVGGDYVYSANEGVRISKIVDYLLSGKIEAHQKAEIEQWII